MVNPIQAFWFIVVFLALQQVRGKSCIPARCGPFGTPALYVGSGGGHTGWQHVWCFGDAGVYSVVCCGVYTDWAEYKTKAEEKDSARGKVEIKKSHMALFIFSHVDGPIAIEYSAHARGHRDFSKLLPPQ